MKQRKTFGILMILSTALIMLGIVVCTVGLSVHVVYLYDRYQGFAQHGYFDSFLHYYYAVGKGNLAVSVLLGMIPVGLGIYLLRKR